jgi:hypothetical protein
MTITDGIMAPVAMVVDKGGDVIVANGGSGSSTSSSSATTGSVTVYRAGQTSAAATLTNGVLNPSSIALDAKGELFVANYGTGLSSGSSGTGAAWISVYTTKSTSPVRRITDQVAVPRAMAVTTNGELFVANYSGSSSSSSGSGGFNYIAVYGPASRRALHVIRRDVSVPVALAVMARY